MDAIQAALYDSITSGRRNQTGRKSPLTDAAGRLEGPFNAMLFTPRVGLALESVGDAIRYDSMLPGRAREIAILEVARACRSDYEWGIHEESGEAAGLTRDEIQSLRDDTDAVTFTTDEVLVRHAVRRLVTSGDLSDAEFELAERQLGYGLVMELLVIVGYYSLIALAMQVWRVPLPAAGQGAFAPWAATDHADFAAG
jgi:alkylhydroperoxidase family enzyme